MHDDEQGGIEVARQSTDQLRQGPDAARRCANDDDARHGVIPLDWLHFCVPHRLETLVHSMCHSVYRLNEMGCIAAPLDMNDEGEQIVHSENSARDESRRNFVSAAAIGGIGLILTGTSSVAQQPAAAQGKSKPSDVNATEDLMREHGVLNRVLLIYEEGIRRINTGSPPSADLLSSAAEIIRKFIEAYHEKLEEEQVFPRLEKVSRLVDLTRVLRAQHAAGQKLTAEILKDANAPALKNKGQAQA